jgi:adenosylcobyric acid synthase
MELLEPEDRARICGFIINKFRGDESLLRPGVAMIEKRLGLPCLGVVPFLQNLGLDEEDGVALEDRPSATRRWKNVESGPARALRIGVIALPHMANFTDFDPLALEPAVSLAYLEDPSQTAAADLVILPGTKQTLDDLTWLEQRGFVHELRCLHRTGIPIVGICGGFQILGRSIEDPQGVENQGRPVTRAGLGLLPVRTVLHAGKTVRRVCGSLRCSFFSDALPPKGSFEGYEIHVGQTLYENGARPLADIVHKDAPQPVPDGAVSHSGRVFGTYVHGFFDRDDFRHLFIQAARAATDLFSSTSLADVGAAREARINRLACHLRKSLDIHIIKRWIVDPSIESSSITAGASGSESARYEWRA